VIARGEGTRQTIMYKVACQAFPRTTSPDYGRLDYAVAVVFVDRTGPPDAEVAARQLVDREGWDLDEVLYVHEARLEDIDPGIPARAAFERALKDGIGIVYYEVPLSKARPQPSAESSPPEAIAHILETYAEGALSPDQAAKALLDEMERSGRPLNIQLDPALLKSLQRAQRGRDGEA
jgi:hypothetical protein